MRYTPTNVLDQQDAVCCYAKSNKHWTVDPQGLAWEHFHTMSDAVEFGDDSGNGTGACCIPVRASEQDAPSADGNCCIPNDGVEANDACCA